MLADELNANVLCVVEHWLSSDELSLLNIPGFKVADYFSRPSGRHGGSLILVKHVINTKKVLDLSSLVLQSMFEVCCIYLNSFNILCISIYRIPKNDTVSFNIFLERLYDLLNLIFHLSISIEIVLTADFNIDFLSSSSELKNLLYLLKSFGLRHTVCEVTRPGKLGCVGTCIDNIVTSIQENISSARVVPTIVSDHNAILFSIKVNSTTLNNDRKFNYNLIRPVNDFNISIFINFLNYELV